MKKYSLTKAFISMIIFIAAMVLFPAVISFTAEYPDPLIKHYSGRDLVYWKINQVTISPVFDEPETSLVELYFQKPSELFLKSPDQQVYAVGDTIWTYLIKHKQIQKSIGSGIFNPFDYIDSSQTYYRVEDTDNNSVKLRGAEENMEPDSLTIDFNPSGEIVRLEYLDANENNVIMEFLEESFNKNIPKDNFKDVPPEGVEIIDLSFGNNNE